MNIQSKGNEYYVTMSEEEFTQYRLTPLLNEAPADFGSTRINEVIQKIFDEKHTWFSTCNIAVMQNKEQHTMTLRIIPSVRDGMQELIEISKTVDSIGMSDMSNACRKVDILKVLKKRMDAYWEEIDSMRAKMQLDTDEESREEAMAAINEFAYSLALLDGAINYLINLYSDASYMIYTTPKVEDLVAIIGTLQAKDFPFMTIGNNDGCYLVIKDSGQVGEIGLLLSEWGFSSKAVDTTKLALLKEHANFVHESENWQKYNKHWELPEI